VLEELRYGYARDSTEEQSLARQRSALDAAR
jgi:DNA invertase Pin-like site-specific DNA recombinase